MPLTATFAGWEKNPETGKDEYIIRLRADKREEVPALKVSDIWNKTPLRLEPQSN